MLLDKRDYSCYCLPEICSEEMEAPNAPNQKYIPGLKALIAGRAKLAMNGNQAGGGGLWGFKEPIHHRCSFSAVIVGKKSVISFRLRYQKAETPWTVFVEPRDRIGHPPYIDRKHEILQLRIPQARMGELLWQELLTEYSLSTLFFFLIQEDISGRCATKIFLCKLKPRSLSGSHGEVLQAVKSDIKTFW